MSTLRGGTVGNRLQRRNGVNRRAERLMGRRHASGCVFELAVAGTGFADPDMVLVTVVGRMLKLVHCCGYMQ
ncbi:MAG: hypothetical protein QNI98_10560 [Woeseiaceae bacterium]|nr:hypothetical protein [Woeseiaceae bacterium]